MQESTSSTWDRVNHRGEAKEAFRRPPDIHAAPAELAGLRACALSTACVSKPDPFVPCLLKLCSALARAGASRRWLDDACDCVMSGPSPPVLFSLEPNPPKLSAPTWRCASRSAVPFPIDCRDFCLRPRCPPRPHARCRTNLSVARQAPDVPETDRPPQPSAALDDAHTFNPCRRRPLETASPRISQRHAQQKQGRGPTLEPDPR